MTIELEEQGFLKKILATKKTDEKAASTPRARWKNQKGRNEDIDALMKRIGLKNAVTPSESPTTSAIRPGRQ